MRRNLQIIRDVALPAIIACFLVTLLRGCFYLPWVGTKANPNAKDFHPLLGAASSHKPIRPGSVTRREIEAMLGPPAYLSIDGRATAYDLRTVTALWVAPLCFAVDRAKVKVYVVKFTFDPAGVLLRYDLAENEAFCPWIAQGEDELEVENKPLTELNRFGPKLRMAAMVQYLNSTRPASSQPITGVSNGDKNETGGH